ncbi:MAG: 50S ribosomal protein L23 [Patescibacteria group bacterium]
MAFIDKFKSKWNLAKSSAPAAVKVKDEKKKEDKVDNKKESKILPEVKKTEKGVYSEISSIIVRPVVTEKSARLASAGQYVFEVRPFATKIQVVLAIKNMYGILPKSVNIQNIKGKKVRFGRIQGRRKSWKKALVTLPKGKTLDIYEGV